MSDAPAPLRDHLCLGCPCLCDDLVVRTSGARVESAEHACDLGRAWLWGGAERAFAEAAGPQALIQGRAAGFQEGVEAAAERLKTSRAPILLLGNVSCEAASLAVGLADRVGGVVDLDAEDDLRELAFARDGEITGTLGEVRSRADLVVYWSVDLARFPRHRERHAPDAPGRTVIEGGPPEGWTSTESFAILRLLVSGGAAEDVPAELLSLSERLLEARYGAIFFGSPDAEGMRLVRDLNRGRRFIGMPMGGRRNEAGIESVLAWTAGAPRSVDFSLGHPRYLPGETTRRVASGEYDLLVAIGEVRGSVEADVRIGPGATGTAASAAIEVGRVGIDDEGTMFRPDGVALPARAAIRTGRPSLVAVLRGILARLDAEERRS